jgi:hypothetical protein
MTLKARGNTSYRPDVVEEELALNRLILRALAIPPLQLLRRGRNFQKHFAHTRMRTNLA